MKYIVTFEWDNGEANVDMVRWIIHICDKKFIEYKDAWKGKERKIAEKYQKIKAYAEKMVKDEIR